MIDPDLIIAMLMGRDKYPVQSADEFWDILRDKAEGHVTEIGLGKIYLFISTLCGSDVADELIYDFRAVLNICPVTTYIRQELKLSKLRDHESAVELACAMEKDLDAIVAWNPRYFLSAKIPVYSVGGFVVKFLPRNRIGECRKYLERLLLLIFPLTLSLTLSGLEWLVRI
jgi:hypothetical protein